MKIGQTNFDLNTHAYIMGILNVTPDSFSDGGNYNTIDAALFQTEKMLSEGADMIDIGGESTRPGHRQISDTEEISRVVPIIQAIKKRFSVPLSIDTYKSSVCEAALFHGADFINDIWGFRYDRKMAELAAQYQVPCCLMHNRKETVYTDFFPNLIADLKESVAIALQHGVKQDSIILDPGIGFAKTYEQNLYVMARLEELKQALPYPFLLGASKKSMIGKALEKETPSERGIGTCATTVLAVWAGFSFLRVHDVKENKEACLMTEAILKGGGRNR